MPGRGDKALGKYVSKNFLRLDIGRVKVKVNKKTEQVEEVIVETKIDVPEATENPTMGVDALISERKSKKSKSTNKRKNTK